jgi:pimeloyl-ACP methyl ester carboxylesterase
MAVQTTPANGIELAYEAFGQPSARPLVLVMGLGAQMIAWPEEFCAALVERGFFVVRFDNRDAGLSTHLHDAPAPDLRAILSGDPSSVPYALEDMADDVAGLLDALGIASAHVVGVSLGGMIAQTVATRHPDRVRSLISIMAAPSLELDEAGLAMLSAEPARTREEAVDQTVQLFRLVGSPGYAFDEARIADVAGRSYDRAYHPAGSVRQRLAIHVSGDRTEALRGVRVPTMVVHGEADPLVPVAGGKATAQAIPDAELLILPGMGHDLPRELGPTIIDAITRTADRAGDS